MKTQNYLAINLETKEEFLCEKIEIKGFDNYYKIKNDGFGWFYCCRRKSYFHDEGFEVHCCNGDINILCTSNPSLDIPKVFDEVEEMAETLSKKYSVYETAQDDVYNGFILGYKKAKEEFKWTDKDMLDFLDWFENSEHTRVYDENDVISYVIKNVFIEGNFEKINQNQLLELWQSQQPIKIYFK
jgi:hypothetical protein